MQKYWAGTSPQDKAQRNDQRWVQGWLFTLSYYLEGWPTQVRVYLHTQECSSCMWGMLGNGKRRETARSMASGSKVCLRPWTDHSWYDNSDSGNILVGHIVLFPFPILCDRKRNRGCEELSTVFRSRSSLRWPLSLPSAPT